VDRAVGHRRSCVRWLNETSLSSGYRDRALCVSVNCGGSKCALILQPMIAVVTVSWPDCCFIEHARGPSSVMTSPSASTPAVRKPRISFKIRLSVPASGRRLRKLLRQVANRRRRVSRWDWVGQVALQQILSIVAQGCRALVHATATLKDAPATSGTRTMLQYDQAPLC
jgi:hypothetical protein